jgi:superfamily I DNA/RNA helicase
VATLYAQKKRDLNAMDFDDLLINGLRLFREHPPFWSATASASCTFWWMSIRTPT